MGFLLPDEVIIIGVPYKVHYFLNLSEVDSDGKEELFGQFDPVACEIRLFSGRPKEAVFATLLHEVMHALEDRLNMEVFTNDEPHYKMDSMMYAFADVFIRNGWLSG